MALIAAYDGAYPHPMSAVPDSVKAIIGYVSGPSATHIWTPADAQAVRDSGREFWSIDVPNQSGFSGDTGAAAANRMIDALPGYNRPKSCPVFMDIEYDAYMADPAGADAAAARFQATMNNAGYPRAFAYVPLLAGYGWGARYTYQQPSALPDGAIGWQYENDAHGHPGWDASVFDPSMFGTADPPPPADPPSQYNLGDLMADINFVWWFARTGDGAIWAVNAMQGTYQRIANPHNLSVFKEWLTNAGIPWKGAQVDVAGDMSQFGVEIKDAT